MKFVCDKCKTRYSIGEDRVRGKILKIRCKNCANVITVREGMDADGGGDAAPPEASGRKRSTTAAPAVGSVATARPPAPAPPPPDALTEEWYVSIDGVQSGPLSRIEAQKWVASKPFEADLHCWSEGFDDWLSVDKVGHFRNLRKPRAPERPKTVPPPVPKEPAPKPLFAATMAAIEKEASKPHPVPKAPAIPAARVNGTGSAPVPQTARGAGSGQIPAIPSIPGRTASPSIPGPTPSPSGRTASPSGRFDAQKSPSHAALAAAFDPEPEDGDSRTQLEAPAFKDVADAKPIDPFAAFNAKPEPARTVKQALESDDDDDGLSIGEVSRVVKLADLAPKPKPAASTSQTGAAARIGTGTQSHPRFTQSQPRLSPTELGMNVDPGLLAAGPTPDESMVAQTFAQRHRRGMFALIAFAGLLVAGVAGVLIYITSKQSNQIGGGLGGGTRVIDTSRPEDIVRRQLPPTPGEGSGSATVPTKPKWTGTRPNTNTNVPQVEDDPKGLGLRASEIEDMAAKQGEGTKRCYMRAQKGAMGFEIAEVKKIAVTLTIGKDGVVSNVDLSSHGGDSFGQCLIARIKAWKFRESPSGGTFRISLAFSS